MPLSTRIIRVPVKLVDGHWELLYGGPVKVMDGSLGELHIDRDRFDDKAFLKALATKHRVRALPEGTELRVALTIRGKPLGGAESFLLQPNATAHDHTAKISSETRFVPVSLGGPTELQRSKNRHEGGLWLTLEGMEPRAIESGVVLLPKIPDLTAVDSLNHAFTRLSEIFEPWRKAHTGSIYERIFYAEGNGKWYPLKDLRDRAISSAERQLVQDLWRNVALEIGQSLEPPAQPS